MNKIVVLFIVVLILASSCNLLVKKVDNQDLVFSLHQYDIDALELIGSQRLMVVNNVSNSAIIFGDTLRITGVIDSFGDGKHQLQIHIFNEYSGKYFKLYLDFNVSGKNLKIEKYQINAENHIFGYRRKSDSQDIFFWFKPVKGNEKYNNFIVNSITNSFRIGKDLDTSCPNCLDDGTFLEEIKGLNIDLLYQQLLKEAKN